MSPSSIFDIERARIVNASLLVLVIALNYLPPRAYSWVFKGSMFLMLLDFLLCCESLGSVHLTLLFLLRSPSSSPFFSDLAPNRCRSFLRHQICFGGLHDYLQRNRSPSCMELVYRCVQNISSPRFARSELTSQPLSFLQSSSVRLGLFDSTLSRSVS